MQSDWRAPQLVKQVGIEERSRLLLQFVMQIFCSPLHRMGAAGAIRQSNRPNKTAAAAMSLRCANMMVWE